MNENQTQPVANTETQTNDGIEKTEQQSLANSKDVVNQEQSQNTADKSVKETTTAETASDSESAVTGTKSNDQAKADATQPAQPKDDAAKPITTPAKDDQSLKPADSSTDNLAKSSDNSTAEPPKKLSDVVPSTIVWLSGMVGKKQFDCAGPFSVPFVLDKPTWPYVTVAPNPKYTNQVFDYDADGGAGKWVPTDAKSQGQLLTDLTTQVSQLSKVNGQSQAMTMQQTQMMVQLNQKYDTINDKLDKLLNPKDGDK